MACNSPMQLKLKDGRTFNVPCGYCQGCRMRRIKDWSDRLNIVEQYMSFQGFPSSFMLWTYDDDKLPSRGVELKDVQDFMKRFRQKIKRDKLPVHPWFKYAIVSEYAPESYRPHYHGILLGVPNSCERAIQECWPHGFVFSKPVLRGGIRYVLKYMDKMRSPAQEKTLAEKMGLNPCFFRKSQGIAFDFFLCHIDKIDSEGKLAFGSKKVNVPRSFLDKYGLRHSPDLSWIDTVKEYCASNDYHFSSYLAHLGQIREFSQLAQARNAGDIPFVTNLGVTVPLRRASDHDKWIKSAVAFATRYHTGDYNAN